MHLAILTHLKRAKNLKKKKKIEKQKIDLNIVPSFVVQFYPWFKFHFLLFQTQNQTQNGTAEIHF